MEAGALPGGQSLPFAGKVVALKLCLDLIDAQTQTSRPRHRRRHGGHSRRRGKTLRHGCTRSLRGPRSLPGNRTGKKTSRQFSNPLKAQRTQTNLAENLLQSKLISEKRAKALCWRAYVKFTFAEIRLASLRTKTWVIMLHLHLTSRSLPILLWSCVTVSCHLLPALD